MKIQLKQIIVPIIIIILCNLLIGCSFEKNTQSEELTNNGPYKEHIVISGALWGISEALPDGVKDDIRDLLFSKFNITIKPLNITWDDYMQKIQVWAASSQLPDFFAMDTVGSSIFSNWVDQGIIRALPDDLTPYPNLDKIMNKPDFQVYKYPVGNVNGKYYCIPRINHSDTNIWCNDIGIQVRNDWMENVGITKDPENMQEFITLMKAFVEQDPDRNGLKDTIGLTCYSSHWLGYLMLGYEPGVASGNSTWVKDKENQGKWIPAFMTKDCLEGLKAIKKLYDAGGLDKDFSMLKGDEGADKMASGEAGAFAHGGDPGSLKYVADKFEQINSDKKYEDVVRLLKPLKDYKTGRYNRIIAPIAWSETYFNAKLSDKKIDRFLKLYDYLLSDEGNKLVRFGIEGRDWKMNGDNIVLIPKKDKNGRDISLTIKYPILKIGFLCKWSGSDVYTYPFQNPALQKKSKEMLDWHLANAKPVNTDLRLNFIDYPSRGIVTEDFATDIIKCVMSNDAEKTWRELVAGYLANGYSKIIEDMNAKAAELGITP
jgi:ABC-type sugar transport system, periplasmic component